MLRKDDYSLNYVLKNLVDNFITLKRSDRIAYEKNFNYVTEYVIKELCKDDNFKNLYKGPCLSGSYADNLKIIKPDEFDLLLELELPKLDLIIIKADNKLKSFCRIQITKVLAELQNEPNNIKLYEFLKSITIIHESEYYLDIFKFKEWFTNLMTNIVEDKLQKSIIDKSNNIHFKIFYRRSGPAHTIGVKDEIKKNPENEFDIDFVPGFIFGIKHWIAVRSWTDAVNETWNENNIKWHALPKPIHYLNGKEIDSKRFNKSFLTSYTPLEHSLIKSKPHIKIGIKLFKLLRDRGRHSSVFKSYFIKTLFLWEIDEQKNDKTFWYKPIDELMIIMIQKLIYYLNGPGLNFYWDHNFNMLTQKKKKDLSKFIIDLEHALRKLKNFSTIPLQERSRIIGIFLNTDEIQESGLGMSNQVKKLNEKQSYSRKN